MGDEAKDEAKMRPGWGQDEANRGPQLANTFGDECICHPSLRKQSRWGQNEAKIEPRGGQDNAKMTQDRPR